MSLGSPGPPGRRPGAIKAPARVAILGFGALGQAFADGLRAGGSEIAAWTRPPRDLGAHRARLDATGATECSTLTAAVSGARVVIGAVPTGVAAEIAERAVPLLAPGALYVDPAPQAPEAKRRVADLVARIGASYADVAVIGTVAVDGHRVAMMASGDGAGEWAAFAAPSGFRVSVLDGPAGAASRVKLLRSVYMKGRDALILEMMVAARRHGLEETVVASIGGPAEQVSFEQLVDRVMRSVAQYAGRRAAELTTAAELVAETGLAPVVCDAGAARLRWLHELGITDMFSGERPGSASAVLDAIDRLEARP